MGKRKKTWIKNESADPGRRKGECVREKEFMTQLPGKNNNVIIIIR